MIICPMCGSENDDIDDCCDQCGDPLKGRPEETIGDPATTIDDAAAPPASSPVGCPVCGNAVKEGERACSRCGADLTAKKDGPPAS